MKAPKIRFQGFDGEWEEKKLGDSFNERSERGKGDLELLSVTIADGVIRQVDSDKRNTSSEDKSNYKIVRKGDVPYNSMRMWQGAVGVSSYNGIVSPAYTVLEPKSNSNGKFYVELFKKESTLEIFKRWSQGLTSDTWNLKFPALSTIPFAAPNLDEQSYIANYFSHLDFLIALYQRKSDDLKKVKKFMLRKMFPKQGEKVPEIRFAGFTGEWEEKKLGDITSKIGSGKTPYGGSSAYVDKGIPLIRSQNVHDNLVDFLDVVFIDSKTNESMKNSVVEYGDILLNITGASIGRSAVYTKNEKANVNQHVCIIRPIEQYEAEFIQLNLASFRGQKQIDLSQAGGAREGLNFQQISKLEFSFPSFQEQQKIGSYFSNLDSLITLHQRKADELKTVKQYMLQKMFV